MFKFRLKDGVWAGRVVRRFLAIEKWRGYPKRRRGIHVVHSIGGKSVWLRLKYSVIVFKVVQSLDSDLRRGAVLRGISRVFGVERVI